MPEAFSSFFVRLPSLGIGERLEVDVSAAFDAAILDADADAGTDADVGVGGGISSDDNVVRTHDHGFRWTADDLKLLLEVFQTSVPLSSKLPNFE